MREYIRAIIVDGNIVDIWNPNHYNTYMGSGEARKISKIPSYKKPKLSKIECDICKKSKIEILWGQRKKGLMSHEGKIVSGDYSYKLGLLCNLCYKTEKLIR